MRKWIITLMTLSLLALAACSEQSTDDIDVIKFADAGWDSIRVHNSIAQTIIEEGFGYDTEVTTGTSTATLQALQQGDLNVYMEVWTDNLKEIYEKAIDRGDILRASTNFDDNTQGLYVPSYVIHGDSERGIEAVAPDLKSVKDLEKYADVFVDPEDHSRGRIVGAPSSWLISELLDDKLETFGLHDQYNYLTPGSDQPRRKGLGQPCRGGRGRHGGRSLQGHRRPQPEHPHQADDGRGSGPGAAVPLTRRELDIMREGFRALPFCIFHRAFERSDTPCRTTTSNGSRKGWTFWRSSATG